MLKKRVIIVLQLNDGVLFRTKQFVPDYRYTQNFLGSENADEVTILDITRYAETIPPLAKRKSFVEAAMGYAKFCYTPLCIGGGIRTMDDVAFAFREIGADKVVINTAALEQENLVLQVAEKYGRQAVTVGIDHDANGRIYSRQGKFSWGPSAEAWAKILTAIGAGEIFLNSIERDGSLRGYDLNILRRVVAAVDVPVVSAGGCGGWQHMAEAFAAGADGAATSNIFHLTETSLTNFKAQLVGAGQPVRGHNVGQVSPRQDQGVGTVQDQPER